MKKQTKVLLATALLTLGASFTSMAALSNGTWVLNDEGWQYADKEGEYVDNEWCKSYGVEYWINDDEVLGGSEWVQDDEVEDRWYYAQSDGSKTINAWKYLYAMDDEDEEGDQYWYYFDAKGRMVTGKKTIGDYTYHFNNEGQMLTGWVEELKEGDKVVGYTDANEREDVTGDTIYTDENGAVVKSSWINVFPWDETDGYEGDDEVWYYTTSAGKVTKGKKDIGGLTYIFGADGAMLTEWVGLAHGSEAYVEIKDADSAKYEAVYYCDEDYGYVKKNGWRYLESSDGDDDYWFHFDKLGRAFMATDANAVISASEYTFNDGENLAKQFTSSNAIDVNSKKIDGVVYYFNEQGEMIDGLQEIAGQLVYLEGGARQTGKVTLTDENENDYTFYFGEKDENEKGIEKYVAVTAAYKNYVYVNGQLITSDDSDSYRLVNVNGKDYVVDNNGKIQHKDGKDYGLGLGELTFEADDDYVIWGE